VLRTFIKGAVDFLVSCNTRHFSTVEVLTEGIFQELLFLQLTYMKLEETEWSLRFLYPDKSV